MKIYIYENTEISVPWAHEYKDLYEQELTKLGVDVVRISTASNLQGIILLCHVVELERYRKDKGNMKVIMQMNGTSLLRYNRHVEREQEIKDLKECWLNLTANERWTEYARSEFGLENIHTIGFPVREPVLTKEKVAGRFVIAGRLDPSKLVTLSIKIALDDPNFKKLIVCYPKSSSKLLKYYPTHKDIEYIQCNHEQLLEQLEIAEYFVVSSLDDATCISHVEAIKHRCKTIELNHNEILPHYTSNRENLEKFNPANCARKLKELIDENL